MIEVTEQDGVALLRMADGKANAMSLDFCEALTARFADVLPARAVVVTGTGRIFSAGVDLLRLLDGGVPYIRAFLPALRTMLAAVFSHPRPVVAAINGHAVAGGCVLACAADRRLMARDAGRIGVPELLVGVAFPSVALEIMRCAMAPQYFEDAIFSGATYTPPEAVARGMVHDIVDPHALLDHADRRRAGAGRALAAGLRIDQAADPPAGPGAAGARDDATPRSIASGPRRRRSPASATTSTARCASPDGCKGEGSTPSARQFLDQAHRDAL